MGGDCLIFGQSIGSKYCTKMDLVVNGQSRSVGAHVTTIADLMKTWMLSPEGLMVEHNGQLVKSPAFGEAKLASGDVLEIIQFMGGGA